MKYNNNSLIISNIDNKFNFNSLWKNSIIITFYNKINKYDNNIL